MINFPDSKAVKADYMTIDTNGIWFVYVEAEMVCLINKDGIRNIPFIDFDSEMLEKIKLGASVKEEGINFCSGDEKVNIKDLFNKEKDA